MHRIQNSDDNRWLRAPYPSTSICDKPFPVSHHVTICDSWVTRMREEKKYKINMFEWGNKVSNTYFHFWHFHSAWYTAASNQNIEYLRDVFSLSKWAGDERWRRGTRAKAMMNTFTINNSIRHSIAISSRLLSLAHTHPWMNPKRIITSIEFRWRYTNPIIDFIARVRSENVWQPIVALWKIQQNKNSHSKSNGKEIQ